MEGTTTKQVAAAEEGITIIVLINRYHVLSTYFVFDKLKCQTNFKMWYHHPSLQQKNRWERLFTAYKPQSRDSNPGSSTPSPCPTTIVPVRWVLMLSFINTVTHTVGSVLVPVLLV